MQDTFLVQYFRPLNIRRSKKNNRGAGEVLDLFRRCPACGHRFHVELEDKKLVEHFEEKIDQPQQVTNVMTGTNFAASQPVFVVQKRKPKMVDVEEFQYTLKCDKCRHEWTEEHVEKRELS